ncbi:MAG TPA: substrate-binding domain-containing protein, partial [Pirellulales bacterium]|nr:substrate-binding domain-containing protein [Pirellulales bacterium]
MKSQFAVRLTTLIAMVCGSTLPAAAKDESVGKAPVAAAAPPAVDAKLADYKSVTGVSGRLKSVGSDTMNNLMTLWSDDFKVMYPAVKTEIEGKGSGTAPPALVEGTADIGPMSRDINPTEIAKFREKFGYD